MSELVQVQGFAHAVAAVRTVGDLRELVAWLDTYRVDGAVEVEWGSGAVYVTVADSVAGLMVECGDHVPGDTHYDVVLSTRVDSDSVPSTNGAHSSPGVAVFDWPNRDRSARLADRD